MSYEKEKKYREFVKLLEYNKGTGLTYATLCILDDLGFKLIPPRICSPQHKRDEKGERRESNQ